MNESLPTLLPEGEYTARYLHHETKKAFGDHKVYVHFELLDHGTHYLTKLYRAYRVRDFKGKSGKGGGVILGKRSELFITLCHIFEGVKDFRPDRVSLKMLKHFILLVTVKTVTNDYKQRKLPECLKYSVIDKLVRIEAGSIQ